MAHSRGSRFPSRNGSRWRVSWQEGPLTNGVQTATANGAILWAVNQSAAVDDLTIVRLRGELSIWLEVVTAIGDGFPRAAIGFCVVNENAAGIGVTAVPSPLVDISWDGWFYHQLIGGIQGLSVTESENTGPLSQVRLVIDSKVMRKMHQTDAIMVVMEFSGEVGAATVAFAGGTRVLMKLP